MTQKAEIKDDSFEKKVRGIDWTKYLEPEYYDPERMFYNPDRTIKALIQMSQFNDFEAKSVSDGLGSEVRYSIGNDHRGTYYPAALEAIDLIIEIEKHSDLEAARKYAAGILSDLYYFQLEMAGVNEQLYEAIESSIKAKLQLYSAD